MGGYEVPRILKLPEGECRQTPRRLPVDIGDVIMNMRMDPNKTRFVNESISKYAQGSNPYGEFGYPYKVNKNNIRPPIIDPKFYQAISRMPVKFDSVTAGPITKDLYGKQVEISKIAPQVITTRVCTDAESKLSSTKPEYLNAGTEGNIEHHLKTTPRTSIPYWPSIPVHLNTGVPEMELDAKIFARPNMGIHAPYQISDPSRDVLNMRTPMHVAFKPGYKDPYTFVTISPEQVTGINESAVYTAAQTNAQGLFMEEPVVHTLSPDDLPSPLQMAFNPNLAAPTPVIGVANMQGPNLTPKVQTSAWYNPSYQAWPPTLGWHMGDPAKDCKVKASGNNTTGRSNASWLNQQGQLGQVELEDSLNLGSFEGKTVIPAIHDHPEYNRARAGTKKEYFFIGEKGSFTEPDSRNEPEYSDASSDTSSDPRPRTEMGRLAGIRNSKTLMNNRPNVENSQYGFNKNTPVGTSGFIKQYG